MRLTVHRLRYDSAAAGMVLRLDRSTLAEPVRLPSGALRGEMVIAHTGVLVYTHADDPSIPRGQERRELVRADALSDPAFLDALRGLPITVEHVPSATPRNMRRVRVGTLLDARWDAEREEVVATYQIDDERGLDALARGLRDVSLGYGLELREVGGVDPKHGRYDAEQVRRVPDHLALTTRGRAGRAHLRADRAGDTMDPKDLALALAEHGVRFDADAATPATVAAAVREALQGAQTRADSAAVQSVTAERDALQARADALTAERDAAVAERDALKVGDGEAFRAVLTERKRLDSLAATYKVQGADSMDTTALGAAIVRAAVPTAPAEPSAEYVRAALDMLAAQAPARRFDGLRPAPAASSQPTAAPGFTEAAMRGLTGSAPATTH